MLKGLLLGFGTQNDRRWIIFGSGNPRAGWNKNCSKAKPVIALINIAFATLQVVLFVKQDKLILTTWRWRYWSISDWSVCDSPFYTQFYAMNKLFVKESWLFYLHCKSYRIVIRLMQPIYAFLNWCKKYINWWNW